MLRRALKVAANPTRIWDKVTVQMQKRAISEDAERTKLLRFLDDFTDISGGLLLREYRESEFRSEYVARVRELEAASRVEPGTTSDFDLEALYLLVRVLRPQLVVETGVLYGASSAHILEGLRRNGGGQLVSLDFPNPNGFPSQSALVPERLRSSWILELGDIRETLPQVLRRVRSIDHFHHDSQHTYEHMMFEYRLGWNALTEAGFLSSHDVIRPLWRRSAPRDLEGLVGRRMHRFRNIGVILRT